MGGISTPFEMISRSCSLTKPFHSLRARKLRQSLTLDETIAPQMVDREMATAQCTMRHHGSACRTVQRQAYALRTTTLSLTPVSHTSASSMSSRPHDEHIRLHPLPPFPVPEARRPARIDSPRL